MKKKNVKKPFFAQLLTEQEVSRVGGGENQATSPSKDIVYTMKYPSDSDESTPYTDQIW
ncbi:MAG: microviridin/marinostatin family tricyclic proteinase inhibitor [Dinghuibacter sp.]|nr:microviridin/marinostatin family tricyclic proteinase inhibitor [Dinghuibacter sp.]